MKLHENWRHHTRASSFRIAVFWGVLNGAVLGLAAFQDFINPWLFLTLNMVGYGTIAVARLTKQQGFE
jgi:hypothetical protein